MAQLEINDELLSTFFIDLLLVYAYWWKWRRYLELGMKIPGTTGLTIYKKLSPLYHQSFMSSFPRFYGNCTSYSPVSRFWIGPVLVVVLTDQYGIESVVKQDKLLRRWYLGRKLGEPVFRNGLLCIDEEKWRRHRKLVSADLHMNILETFVGNSAKNNHTIENKLRCLAERVTVHDIPPYIIRCTLDV
jgi:hypothetical protein